MRFELDVGEKLARVSFYRNWFTGTMRVTVNGKLVAWASVLNPLNHFSYTLMRTIRFPINDLPEDDVIIVKVRPQWLAGMRPHLYSVVWKGKLIAQHHGY